MGDRGVEGSYRFIQRVWRLIYHYLQDLSEAKDKFVNNGVNSSADKDLRRLLHGTIKRGLLRI